MRTKMNVLFAVVSVVVIAGCKSEADRACQQGEEALAKGDYRAAEANFVHALTGKPDFFEAHNGLGLALAKSGRVNEAVAHYRKALEIKPDYAEAHNNLGMALTSLGRNDEAIAHYRKALEIKPDYAEARKNLEMASGKGKQGKEAAPEPVTHTRFETRRR